MACCGKGRKARKATPGVMGNYKYLNSTQIEKRLEAFKRLYCGKCDHKQACNYVMYEACEKVVKSKEL